MAKTLRLIRRHLALALDFFAVLAVARVITAGFSFLQSAQVRAEMTLTSLTTTHDHVSDEASFGSFIAIGFTYFVASEWRFGQTVSKRVFLLKVFMRNGDPLTLKASIIRNFYRLLDLFTVILPVGMFAVIISPLELRLGDHLARTRVMPMYKGHPEFNFDD